MSKVSARVDLGPNLVDVDWGDGTTDRALKGVQYHDYEPGVSVTVTVTEPGSGLSASTRLRVPGSKPPDEPRAAPPDDKPAGKAKRKPRSTS